MTREKAEKEIRAVFIEPWADGIIKALEQEPRKGHWIYKEFDERTGMTNVHICSKCGYPLASPINLFVLRAVQIIER